MAQQDLLQPSLLDRLTDDEPQVQQETRDKRFVSLRRLREAVIRDLAWLLNTSDFGSVEDLTNYPLVTQTALNYGMPALSGRTTAGLDARALERLLRQAIQNFEPRIIRKTLKVRVVTAEGEMSHNALNFEIEGELWAQPVPQHLLLKAQVDLEMGEIKLSDRGGQGAG